MSSNKPPSGDQSCRANRMLLRVFLLALLALVPVAAQLVVAGPALAATQVFATGQPLAETTPVEPPTVDATPASSVTQSSATLNGTVNPNGVELSECELEYGTTTSYGSSAPCAPSPGAASVPVAVSVQVTGLAANTTYHFRLSAENAGGRSKSEDIAFTTPAPAVAPTVFTDPASSPTETTASLHAAVDPNGSEVTECKFEYGTTSSYGSSAPCEAAPGSGKVTVPVSAALTGLTANTTYHFRISATNAGGTSKGSEVMLTTSAPGAHPPTVRIGSATTVTQSSATVSGTVNPDGHATNCEFEYGIRGGAWEGKAQCSPEPGSGDAPVEVSASIANLTRNKEYRFRIIATSDAKGIEPGGTETSLSETFTTLPNPPVVATEGGLPLGYTSAVMSATVNPNTVSTEGDDCRFEYGTTTAYGASEPCTPEVRSGSVPVKVSAQVTGLASGTTYHFRISSTNADGTSEGADATFTTPLAPPSESPPSAGESNSPPATVGSTASQVTTSGTPLPAPVLSRTANIAPLAGKVKIRPPGTRTFVALSGARQIPYDTIVEATHGEVSVTAATPGGGTQKGDFFDGEFILSQGKTGRVLATLTGGDFSVCPAPASTARAKASAVRSKSASRTHLVRRLWAEARGNFSTRGRYAGGIVQGAQWLTEDMCEGTLILATREHVEVTDLVRHRRVEVATGAVYIAKHG